MSGSPVLSLRTGAICGVLKATRDARQALGGYAIPIQALFRLAPSLERVSNRYHEADSTWYNALPSDQRRRMAIGQSRTASTQPAASFVLTVKQTAAGWEASAAEHPGGAALSNIGVDLSAVRGNVARVFRYWVRRGRGDATDETKRLGSILAAVLPDGIGERLNELLDAADGTVELLLHFDDETDPDLIYLAWENLFIGRPGTKADVFVARETKLAFARTIEREFRQRTAPTRRSIDVLLVEADPDADAAEDDAGATSVARISQELKQVAAHDDRLTVEPLANPSAMALADALEEGRYDVVHYVGYGRFVPGDPPADELALRGGDSGYVNAEAFAGALASSPPTLAVLQLCEGPDDMAADLSTFATPLLTENGTQAVIAYQFPLRPALSTAFNAALYEKLLAGRSVAMAAQAARNRVWLKDQRSGAFLSPATFLYQPPSIALTAEPHDSSSLSRSSALMSYA